jgi:hypothetical protein
MITNLALGSLLIAATVLIHTIGLMTLSHTMVQLVRWWRLHRHASGRTVAMVATVLGLFFIHTIEVWLWAVAYMLLGPIPSFPDALYFSTVTFSTIGYGDVLLSPDWRLFGSLEGINGFLLIGWSTAYLISASTRHGPFRLGEHF